MAEPFDPVVLDIPVATVCGIISRAKALGGKEAEVTPNVGSNPTDDDAMPAALQTTEHDPYALEIRAEVDSMGPDGQATLVALLLVGRGDFGAEGWESALDSARSVTNGETSKFLIENPLLGSHLEAGLNALGHSCG